MIDLNATPEVFIEEREKELGEELPTQITIQVSKLLAVLLRSEAIANDRSLEYVARRILELWAEQRRNAVFEAKELLEKLGSVPTTKASRAARRSEYEIRNDLATQLSNLGFVVSCEVNTGAGNADIVLRRADGDAPLAVIEVKVEIASWRECHQATGQATAYAKALKCKQWFVTAPSIDKRLLKDRVIMLDDAAATIHTALGGGDAA